VARASANASAGVNAERARVLEFWRAIELFSPQTVPAPNSRKRVFSAGDRRAGAHADILPWQAGHPFLDYEEELPAHLTWRHTVYGGIFSLQRMRGLLEDAFGTDEESFDARDPGESALFSVTVTDEGRPLLGSEDFASCAWAVGRLNHPGPKDPGWLDGFEADRGKCEQAFGTAVRARDDDTKAAELRERGFDVGRPLDLDVLTGLIATVAERFRVTDSLQPAGIRVSSFPVSLRRQFVVDGAEFLNSFFTADLEWIADEVAAGKYGAALAAYLRGPGSLSNTAKRVDIRERPDAVDKRVAPKYTPAGRWPTRTTEPLSRSQQFAVNTVLDTLRSSPGIIAVNGPPGTGKTTMLRDLIAALVVERASRLAALAEPADAFTGEIQLKADDRTRVVSTWKRSLTGFEIVVASSNNGAVENISQEIPGLDAIDSDEWLTEASHYPELASAVLNAGRDGRDGRDARDGEVPAWGLVAGRLGRKSHRQKFATAFWYGNPDKGVQGFDDILRGSPPSDWPTDWPTAVRDFRSAQAKVETFHTERSIASPPSPEWLAARTRLFLQALRLHQALVAAEPKRFRDSLRAAVDIVSGGVPSDAPAEAVHAAWQSLFFVVPVLSTTFASFPRVFSRLGRESIGWLFIDEAGQAMPQAAVGAIWRSRRAVVVGDPMQLEPVVTLPLTAQQALRANARVDEWWLPSRTSAQHLADEATKYGTYLPGSGGRVWVGAPLRVHRRCERPMFDVSNAIAYDGLMEYGTDSDRSPLEAPPSMWLDVPTVESVSVGHWVPAEGEQARKVISALLSRYGVSPKEIFVLSPFRDVATGIERIRREFRGVRGGTVHTAQGKEADVVVLILGGHPRMPRAKEWASERPNLLNVAVSRARRRLYVIGDRTTWSRYPFFDTLDDHLSSPLPSDSA
jgi:hypothetical protein